MKQPKVKALLRLDKPLADSTYPIWIRITHLRKSSYLSTGYSCLEEEWDSESSRLYEMKPRITSKHKEELNPDELKKLKQDFSIVKVNPLAKKVNAEIDKQVRKILSTRDKMEANEQSISSKNLKKQLVTVNSGYSDKSFLHYYDKQVQILEGNEAFGTAKTYKSILKVLKEDFLKGKDLTFDEISLETLQAYEASLRAKGLKIDTIANHLKTFRAVYYRAIKEKIVSQDKNPFFLYRVKKERFKLKDRLNAEEIKLIKDLELKEGSCS